ncbi:MAG: hypothetical protein F4062_00850 [Acidimicrobiia bacterium]|nr:hypothetical protein [Acidimicrobiia bacterium]
MSAGPPKRHSGRRSRRGSDAVSRPSTGRQPGGTSAGAQRRRRRGKPERARTWRIVLWVGVAVALAWVAVAMVVFLGDDDELPPPRPEELIATAAGCDPVDFSVEPGESVVFRVTNTTDSDFEVIVTDEAGVALRTSPGYDPDSRPPWGASESGAGPAASQPRLLVAGLLAHEGHEDEAGPNANMDYRYRMIVAENGVRIMIVTFPEIGEFAPLTRFVCAALGPDGELDPTMPVGRIDVVTSGG